MILLSSPLKNDPLETTVSIYFFLEIEIFTTKIVNSKVLKKICRQLLSTMNVLKQVPLNAPITLNTFQLKQKNMTNVYLPLTTFNYRVRGTCVPTRAFHARLTR